MPLVDLPGSAGMLATGGGLIFTGKLTGEFVALDAATGKQLWQFQTGSSINSTAITYTYKGQQFVTIASAERRVGESLCCGKDSFRRLDLDVCPANRKRRPVACGSADADIDRPSFM
jgi:outer membrane protein assembly factor BamB